MEGRNNLDSPPTRPLQAWGEQTNSGQPGMSRSVSNQSWISSSSDDQTTAVDSSFEIINELEDTPTRYTTNSPPVMVRSLASQRQRGTGVDVTSPPARTQSDKTLFSPVNTPTSPGPVPVPRKRVTSQDTRQIQLKSRYELENKRLVEKLNALSKENCQLCEQVKGSTAKIRELETTNQALSVNNETMQSQSSKQVQSLEKKIESLTEDLSRVQLHLPATVSPDSQRELREVKSQLEKRVSEVSLLHQEKEDLKRKLTIKSMESPEASVQSKPGSKTSKRIEVRLSEAIQKQRELEYDNEELRDQLREQNSKVDSELEETKLALQRVIEEKELLEQKHLVNAVQQKEGLDAKVQQLTLDLSTVHNQLASSINDYSQQYHKMEELENSYSELQTEKEGLESQCQDLQEQLGALKEGYAQHLSSCSSAEEGNACAIQELTAANAALKEQIVTLAREKEELSSRCDTLTDDHEKLYDKCTQLQTAYKEILGVKQQETQVFQQALEEMQKEADSTLGDFQSAANKLSDIEKERDEYRMKHEQSLNILASRSKEVIETKTALEKCEHQWRMKLEEKLQQEREEAEQMNKLMDAQMNQYREDFNEERKAREKMADEKLRLAAMIAEKDEENKRLKVKLNEQAAKTIQDDFEESEYPDIDDSEPPLRAVDPDQRRFQQTYPGPFLGRGGQGGQNY